MRFNPEGSNDSIRTQSSFSWYFCSTVFSVTLILRVYFWQNSFRLMLSLIFSSRASPWDSFWLDWPGHMPTVAGGICCSSPTWMAHSSPIVRGAAPPKTHELRDWRGSFLKEMGYIFQKKGRLSRCQSGKTSNCLLWYLSKVYWIDLSLIVSKKMVVLWWRERVWMNSLGIDSLLLAFSATLAMAYCFFQNRFLGLYGLLSSMLEGNDVR